MPAAIILHNAYDIQQAMPSLDLSFGGVSSIPTMHRSF